MTGLLESAFLVAGQGAWWLEPWLWAVPSHALQWGSSGRALAPSVFVGAQEDRVELLPAGAASVGLSALPTPSRFPKPTCSWNVKEEVFYGAVLFGRLAWDNLWH